MKFPQSKINPRKIRYRAIGLVFGIISSILLSGLLTLPSWGQVPSLPPNVAQSAGFLADAAFDDQAILTGEVRLDGRSLFAIAAPALGQAGQLGATTPIEERIQGIERTLVQVANSEFDPDELEVRSEIDESSRLPVITINDQYLMTVTTLDAQLQVQEPERWANQLTGIIRQSLIRARQERQPEFLTRQALIASAIILVTLICGWIIAYWQGLFQARKKQLEIENPPDTSTPADIVREPLSDPMDLRRGGLKRHYQNLIDLRTRLLQIAQFSLFAAALFIVLGLFPYTRWLQPFLFSAPLQILLIGMAVYLLIRFSDILIDRFTGAFARRNQIDPEAYQRISLRISTFSRVLKSGAGVIWLVIGILAALSVVGVDLVPLLAGAGIIGLAISFAAQSLVKDMINGALILFEDQYAVGDVINLGEVSGFVENMNLRITQLRDSEGQLITVPNSAIAIVRNLSKDWSRVDLSIDLAYGTNPDHALAVIRSLSQEIYADPAWRAKMPEPPEVLGIDEVDHTGLLIRVWIKTLPLQQWKVAREFRRRLAHVLEQEGLAIGIPQQSLYFKSSQSFDTEWQDRHHEGPLESVTRE
ncbi:mechanosensitive ion channel family protein [Pseudanabaena sp. FACHB-2040]|uniref:mechanosensitive ion channel family protein n=1 Tax=Pseudanabaena sp. FACHB-2040 TaxID=2692859 RepID=UPI00168A0A03|nr:mechanosensitive ion channel family protein [Pseudanabaena sp. FACHB-2040]MBD2256308.1 mechanosensitive ion channel family protein [Pseudanabaena sp. FACHB-2040]